MLADGTDGLSGAGRWMVSGHMMFVHVITLVSVINERKGGGDIIFWFHMTSPEQEGGACVSIFWPHFCTMGGNEMSAIFNNEVI